MPITPIDPVTVAPNNDEFEISRTKYNRGVAFTGGTDGALIVRDTSVDEGGYSEVAPGALGQVLVGAGAGQPPTFATLAPSLLNQLWFGFVTSWASAAVEIAGVNTDNPTFENLNLSSPNVMNTIGGVPYKNCLRATATTSAYQTSLRASYSAAASNSFQLQHDLTFDLFVATGNETNQHVNMKYWLGMFDASGALTGSSDDTPSANFVGFRFSTAAGDTNWNYVRRNGAATTVVDSGVAVAANTAYRFRIRVSDDGTSVAFSINGGVETVVTTLLPAATTGLIPHVLVWKGVTGVNELRGLGFNRMLIRVGDPLTLT